MAAKYNGPFQILKSVGQVAYKLQLSKSSVIHHMLHVSLLKKKLGYKVVPQTQLPAMIEKEVLIAPAATILKTRTIMRNSKSVVQDLV